MYINCFYTYHPVFESQEKSRKEEKESFHGSLILMKEQRVYLIKIKKENLEVLEMRFFEVKKNLFNLGFDFLFLNGFIDDTMFCVS